MTRRQGAPPPMDPATGLTPGQSWAIAPGPTWQARMATGGGWHVIGRTLADHPEHGPRYASAHRFAWMDFDGAMLRASDYNAAKRQEVTG